MGSPSARRVTRADYHLLLRSLTDMVARLQRTGRKALYAYLDPKAATEWLLSMEHAYIVDEAYLVAYELHTPEFCTPGTVMLVERLVVRLAVSGEFRAVTDFMLAKAREAGAVLALAGTALAKSDTALASLYHRAGYSTQALTLAKEP